jgi:hypothetical protein
MKKKVIVFLSLAFLACALQSSAFAQARKTQERESDSVYMEKKDDRKRSSGGGFFDFLPFVGGRKAKVAPEDLTPSPPPQESKPVLREKELAQLRIVTEQWILGTEYAEPTIRQGDDGKSYRDYIVFSDEYEAKVLRGEAEEKPFIGHIYIQGDYFRTAPHDSPEKASSDFKFTYQSREFRLVFDRIKKWEYSDKPGDEPFKFVERWEFNGLQSRPVVDMSAILSKPEPPAKEMEKAPAPQPESPEPENE